MPTRKGFSGYSLIYFANLAYELGKWAFGIVIIATIVYYFFATIFIISGSSMEPEFHNSQIVIVSRIGLFTGKYSRGDAMVIKFPGDPEHKKYIKRLIGLPGEQIDIRDNKVYINGEQIIETYIRPVTECPVKYYKSNDCQAWFYEEASWKIEANKLHAQGKVLTKPDVSDQLNNDEYFLMGDNRENSNDSRKWYPASLQDMIGPVRFIVWPLSDWGPVVNPYYGNV